MHAVPESKCLAFSCISLHHGEARLGRSRSKHRFYRELRHFCLSRPVCLVRVLRERVLHDPMPPNERADSLRGPASKLVMVNGRVSAASRKKYAPWRAVVPTAEGSYRAFPADEDIRPPKSRILEGDPSTPNRTLPNRHSRESSFPARQTSDRTPNGIAFRQGGRYAAQAHRRK